MSNLILFMAGVGALYLFDALWEFVRVEHEWGKLAKFTWMCVGVVAGKFLFKAITWAVNF